MKSLEEFWVEQFGPISPSAAFTSRRENHPSTLPEEVRQTANLGMAIFPESPLAKLTGNHDLLIAEATSDMNRLEELSAEHGTCGWRVAVDQSSLCILELVGPVGRESFAALSVDQGECLTLQAHRGDTSWAFFRWPKGLMLRAPAKELAPGMRIVTDSCIIPPSGGCAWVNPWAEIETVPYFLWELAFENPDPPPGKAVRVLAFSPDPAPCRSTARFTKPQGGAPDNPPGKAAPVPLSIPRPAPCRPHALFQKPQPRVRQGYPIGGHAGSRSGYRVYRRR
jgi:hypothetical protein